MIGKLVREHSAELARLREVVDRHKVRWQSISGVHQTADSKTREPRVQMLDLMARYFSNEELMELCFVLSVDWDELPGTEIRSKSRALIVWAEKRGLLYKLVSECQKRRPQVDWPSL